MPRRLAVLRSATEWTAAGQTVVVSFRVRYSVMKDGSSVSTINAYPCSGCARAVTHYDKVVAPVALATVGTAPVLVPNMGAIGHVLGADLLAHLLAGASLRHVILLEGAQREVRLRAPANLRQAHIFARLTHLHRVQALLGVVRLIGAHIALQSRA